MVKSRGILTFPGGGGPIPTQSRGVAIFMHYRCKEIELTYFPPVSYGDSKERQTCLEMLAEPTTSIRVA